MLSGPRLRGWLGTALLCGAWLGCAVPAYAAVEQAYVLILLPGKPGQPAATAIAAAIRDVLLTEWELRASIELEHVDVGRFVSPELEERRLRTVYGSKYGNQRFDVIVAALPEPFQFVLRARDELWPGTPVVVCGVDERSVRDLKPPPGFAVLTTRFDMEGTVSVARALLPGTRHVALVGGASAPEQLYHDLIRRAVSAVGLDVFDLTKLPIADVLARVSSLPEHTVVLQSSYQVDGAGRRFYGIDLVPHISKAANRPVFTPLGLALGRGVVGGSIVEFEDMGRDAGMVASRILRGEAPPSVPVPSSASAVPRFDGRQLARWRLDERRLPTGSQIVFHQPTLWHEYRWHVVSAVGLLGAQAALIVMLLAQRRRRHEAQAVTGGVLAALPGETAIIDSSGTILQTNEAWATAARNEAGAQSTLGVGANYLDLCRNATDMPLDVGRQVHTSIESILRGERHEFALEYPTYRHGERRWFEIRVRQLPHLGRGAAVMHFDVTARRQAEAAARRHLNEIAHLDRVAGMGQLASSLAHELNQPLTAILTNAQAATRLLGRGNADLAEVRTCLVDIVSDDRRAAEVIRRMRRLLKNSDVVSLPLAVNDIVATTIGLVWNEALLHGVSIDFTPAPTLSVVYGDHVQIQQVILNLLTNAISAASNAFTARNVSVWTVACPPHIEIGVHDSGPGIAEDDLERLFEPFFTTKEEGLGMGLAISRTIVEAHGGRLVAANDPAGGATFRVYLHTEQPGTMAVGTSPPLDRANPASLPA
jgi:C4-dicarboxylate-specific signal transduction histidine kinase